MSLSCRRSWTEARLDAIGVFGYSDEDGTEAAGLPGQLPETEVAGRVEELASLADELMAERAADRIGETAEVLIDEVLAGGALPGPGRAPGARGGRRDRGSQRRPRSRPATW